MTRSVYFQSIQAENTTLRSKIRIVARSNHLLLMVGKLYNVVVVVVVVVIIFGINPYLCIFGGELWIRFLVNISSIFANAPK